MANKTAISIFIAAMSISGCASYVTPGGAAAIPAITYGVAEASATQEQRSNL